MYNRDRARYDSADLNGNGLLSKDEWILFNNPMRDAVVIHSVIEEALTAVDMNNDGKLELEEYLADWHIRVML